MREAGADCLHSPFAFQPALLLPEHRSTLPARLPSDRAGYRPEQSEDDGYLRDGVQDRGVSEFRARRSLSLRPLTPASLAELLDV